MKSWVTAVIVVVCLAVAAGTGVLLWYFLRPSASPPYVTIELDGSFGNAPQRAAFARVPAGDVFWWWYAGAGDRPVLLVLGGVTDLPASLANLAAIGPNDFNMNLRNDSWVSDYNLLFIDTLGTGFSRVANANSVPKDVDEAAEHLFWALESFYSVYDELSASPLYILGQGHGAQLALALAIRLQNAEEAGTLGSNTSGVAMGNAWISPVDATLTWAPLLLAAGLVDQAGHDDIQVYARETEDLFNAGEFAAATTRWGDTQRAVFRHTGSVDFYNILTKMPYNSNDTRAAGEGDALAASRDMLIRNRPYSPRPARQEEWDLDVLMNTVVKEALGVPDHVVWGSQSNAVFNYLSVDFMKPVTEGIERLLNETDIIVMKYNGNLDLICDTPGQLLWVDRLNWAGAAAYRSAPRLPVWEDGRLEGYYKSYGNFRFFWINLAGHSVPRDNPAGANAFLRDMTSFG